MNQMLCLAVLVIVAMSSLSVSGGPGHGPSPEFMRQMQEFEDACLISEHAAADDVASFKDHQVPNSQAGKCFVGCVMEKMGLMSNGAFSRTLADQSAQTMAAGKPQLLQKLLDQNIACEQEAGTDTDKCVTGPKVMLCFEKFMKH